MTLGTGHIRVTDTAYGLMAYNRHDIYVGGSLDAYGEFSATERDALLELIPSGGVVVDVGANIGALAVPLARKAGMVFALEPQREVFALLRSNMVLNSLTNLQVGNFAAGAETGMAWFPCLDYTATNNYGGVSLLREVDIPDPASTYSVDVVPLDTLLSGAPRIDLIKIDVEGMEREVLQGAVGIIRKFRPVLYVEDDRQFQREALRSFITDVLDYDFVEHTTHLFNPENIRGHKVNIWGAPVASFNLICTPREVADVT